MLNLLFRWRIRLALALTCLLLVTNSLVIVAQEATDEPVPSTDFEVLTETEAFTPTPTDLPTATSTPIETPTLVPVETLPPEVTDEPTSEIPTSEATEEAPEATPDTSQPIPPAPEPPFSLLVRELFDNGDLSPWVNPGGWSLVSSESGLALQVVNTNAALQLQKGGFYNAAAQSRFFITAGSAQISLRESVVGSYTASVDASGLVQLSRAGVVVQTALIALDPAAWHTLRLSTVNDVVRVAVDSIEIMVYQDSSALPPGNPSLSAFFADTVSETAVATNTLLVDDFFLWVPEAELSAYPSPTPVATLPPVPTEETVVPVPTETVPTVEIPEVTPESTPDVTSPDVTPEVTPPEATEEFTDEGKPTGIAAPPTAQQLLLAAPPDNDNFAARMVVSVASPFLAIIDSGDTTEATLELNEQLPICGQNVNRTVWYEFTPLANAQYTFTTEGSSFDTVIGVYTGADPAAVDTLTRVNCNDDASTTVLTSRLIMPMEAGTTYYIQIGGYGGYFGTFNFRIEQVGLPVSGVPIQLTPLNNVTLADTTPTLIWRSVPNAYRYEIEVSSVATFATTVFNASVLAATCADDPSTPVVLVVCQSDVSPALTDGLYFWRVRSLNSNDLPSRWSAVRRLNIRTTGPTLLRPLDTTLQATARPLLTWQAYPGSRLYRVWLGQTDTCPVNVDPLSQPDSITTFESPRNSLSLTTLVRAEPLAQGTWYWCVAAKDASTETWTGFSESFQFVVSLLSIPADNAVTTDTTPLLRWLAAAVARGTTVEYKVQIATDDDFEVGDVVYTSPNLTTTTHTVPSLLDVDGYGTFYWRVLVSYEGGAFQPLETDPPPAPQTYRTLYITPAALRAPVLLSPAVNATLADNTPTFNWREVVDAARPPGPVTYQLQIATDRLFTNVVFDLSPATDQLSHTLSNPLDPVPHYWRVRAINQFGIPGAWAAGRLLNIRTTGPILLRPLDTTLQATARPLLTWQAYPGSRLYRVWLAQSDACPVSGDGATPDGIITFESPRNSLSLTTLVRAEPLSQGTWYWCVAAKDASTETWTGFSESFQFVVSLLSIPADNAVTTDTTPLLRWLAAAVARGTTVEYKVQIATDDDFEVGDVVYTSPNLTTTTHTVPNLLDVDGYGTFYWRVLVSYEGGAFQPLETDPPPAPQTYRTLYIAPAVVRAPVLSNPRSGSVSVTMPELSWRAVPAASAGGPFTYDVQIATARTFADDTILDDQSVTGLSVLEYEVNPALPHGLYYWRVRAVNSFGTPGLWSAFRTFEIDTTATLAPRLTLPANNSSTTANRPSFRWAAPVGGVTYELRYTTNFDPTDPDTFDADGGLATTGTFTVTQIRSLAFVPPSPLLPTAYYWQVRAFDRVGNPSDWSEVRTFKVNSPANVAPQPYRFGPGDAIILTWSPISWTVPGGYYEVQVDNNTNFSSPEFQRAAATSNFVSVTEYLVLRGVEVVAIPPLPNGTWYWRVRACSSAGTCGAWSTTGTFTVEK